ncbi:MAG: hypothetical protein WA666_02405 [Nitrospirota bacterium]
MVLLVIAIVSIISAWLISIIFTKLKVALPWWIESPSVIGFYGLFYTVFDKYLWRTELIRKIGLVNTPDFEGKWDGNLFSSFGKNSYENVNVKIIQTWTKMQILLFTNKSQSHSLAAFISVNDPGGPSLIYQYQNNPKPNAINTMQIHYGTTKLNLTEQGLEGEYYSGRGRQNYGSLSLKKSHLAHH